MRSLFNFGLKLCVTGLITFIGLTLFAFFLAPDISNGLDESSPQAVTEVLKLREMLPDADQPAAILLEVDTEEGSDAAWFPKNESPLLKELVDEGRLPTLLERMPKDPLVIKGVDGIGNYGGTWYRAGTSAMDAKVISWRIAANSLVRWSPMGYPIQPNLAKSWTVSEDGLRWVFKLREGIRWSDGHPYTAADIDYWWNHEILESFKGVVPHWMTINGQPGSLKVIDEYTVVFEFPAPNPLFLESLASTWSLAAPRHYLEQYHPKLGDPAKIDEGMKAYGINSPESFYSVLKQYDNPDHPRLWPWIYPSARDNPPEIFIRNPYFWAVDEAGNQLPYLDRVVVDSKYARLISLSAAGGELSMQTRSIRFEDYTLLMENREKGNYDVFHWYPASRSVWAIWPNLNRVVDTNAPETKWKKQFLDISSFRQALSLAINRDAIIESYYSGVGEPSQIAPGFFSEFHSPMLSNAYTDYAPEEANSILDGLGLIERDSEGMRTFPDGTRMSWYIDFTSFTGEGPIQYVIDDWAKVGVRAIQRERNRPLFSAERRSGRQDFTIWTGDGEFNPLSTPASFIPTHPDSNFASKFGMWYSKGGFWGNTDDEGTVLVGPEQGTPIYRAVALYEDIKQTLQVEDRQKKFQEIFAIAAEELFSINIATPPPQLVVVKDGFKNVPPVALYGAKYGTPANTAPEVYFWEYPDQNPVIDEQILDLLSEKRISSGPKAGTLVAASDTSPGIFSRLLSNLYWILPISLIAYASIVRPFILRRILIMIPTLLIMSIGIFYIIQLPPGSFVETKILMLMESGDIAAAEEVERLREEFHLDDSFWKQYFRWSGMLWFTSFDSEDTGLIQGNLGRSMDTLRPVRSMVGERISLTALVSIGTILFTWALAMPIGIYSAVRQYSVGDYIFTGIGFIGMCVPNFLLAILLMYWSSAFLGVNVTGLFSPEFAGVPGWNIAKFVDLLKHIWVPIVVIGTAGTAGMIRVMRANLLDELSKPYVVTAMAKGVRPVRLLLKYPVRLALNPFVSSIGGLFPALISGASIVAIVLSLPMVGPLLLDALMNQDVYLAASMLMVLSLFSIIGTLVSDLLLMLLDPRIRMGGNQK